MLPSSLGSELDSSKYTFRKKLGLDQVNDNHKWVFLDLINWL